MSNTFNAIHYLPICNYFFHLNSSLKCNIMHYVLALALSSICQNHWVSCGTVSSMLSGLMTRSLGLNTLGTT